MIPKICINPHLNNFLYDIIYSATSDEKKSVPRRYIKKIRTCTAAKKFVNQSYLEEKQEVLSGLGIGWFMVLYDVNKNRHQTIGQMFEKAKTGNRNDLMKTISDQKLYVMSDRQFAFYVGLMADSSNNSIFMQNLLLNKAGYHVKKWNKIVKDGETQSAFDHEKLSPQLVEFGLNITMALDYVEGYCDIAKNDFKILSYLYVRQNRYVSHKEVVQRLGGNLNPHKITGCIRRLLIASMIQRPPKAGVNEYQITAIGLRAIAKFWKEIIRSDEIK